VTTWAWQSAVPTADGPGQTGRCDFSGAAIAVAAVAASANTAVIVAIVNFS